VACAEMDCLAPMSDQVCNLGRCGASRLLREIRVKHDLLTRYAVDSTRRLAVQIYKTEVLLALAEL